MNIISTGCIAIANTHTHTRRDAVHQWNINTAPATSETRIAFAGISKDARRQTAMCDANTNAFYAVRAVEPTNMIEVYDVRWCWIRISSHIIEKFLFFIRCSSVWSSLDALHARAKSDKKTRVATRHRTHCLFFTHFSHWRFIFFFFFIISIRTRNHFSLLDTVFSWNWLCDYRRRRPPSVIVRMDQ